MLRSAAVAALAALAALGSAAGAEVCAADHLLLLTKLTLSKRLASEAGRTTRWQGSTWTDWAATAAEHSHPRAPRGAAAAPRPEVFAASFPDLVGDLGNKTVHGILNLHANGTSTNQTVAEYVGVTSNSEQDGGAFLSALLTNTLLIIVAVLVFLHVCKQFPEIYRSRMLDSTCPPLSSQNAGDIYKPFGWMHSVRAVPSSDAQQFCGLDGALLLDFLDLAKGIFLTLTIVLCGVLVPVHILSPDPSKADPMRDWLAKTNILNVKRGSDWYWVHVALTWLVTLGTLKAVFAAQTAFAGRRQKWLKERPSPECMTILVENIPTAYCTDEALTDFFLGMFPHEPDLKAMVVKQTVKLRRLMGQKANLEDSRTKLEFEWKKEAATLRGGAGDAQVDVQKDAQLAEKDALMVEDVAKMTTKLNSLQEDIQRERDWVLLRSSEKAVRSNTGFVTFTTRRSVSVAKHLPYTMMKDEFLTAAAPEPTDVLYEQLSVPRSVREYRWVVGVALMCLLFILWLPVTFLISSATSLTALRANIHWVHVLCDWSPVLTNFLRGFLSTAALHLVMSFIPMILGYIVLGFFSVSCGAMVQTFILYWYFTFLLIFTVLVTSLSNCVIHAVGNPLKLIDIFAVTLPQASDFYINYVVIACFAVFLELLRIPNLFMFLLYRPWLGQKVAGQRTREEDPIDYGLGARLSKISIVAVVGLIFCTINPIICPMVWWFLLCARTSYGYLLVWVETKKPDLGGELWVMALQQVILGLTIYVMMMTGLLSLRGGGLKGSAVFPLLLVLACAYWRFKTILTWRVLPFSEVSMLDQDDGNGPRRPQEAREEGEAAGGPRRYVQVELLGVGGAKD